MYLDGKKLKWHIISQARRHFPSLTLNSGITHKRNDVISLNISFVKASAEQQNLPKRLIVTSVDPTSHT